MERILADTPRIRLGQALTALEQVPKLSEFIGVPTLIKRDDRLDELGCGHKLRSLEYLLPYHLSLGCDLIVTYGSMRSNHSKSVAVACAKAGIECHVLMGGDTFEIPSQLQGSCLITALSGAMMHWCEGVSWTQMHARAEAFCATLRATGRKPALISPEHGLYPGLLGFMGLAQELFGQLERHSRTNIVLPVGTGSLAAGISIANILGGYNWNLYGVCLTLNEERARQSTERILASLPPELSKTNDSEAVLNGIKFHDSLSYRDYDRFDSHTLQQCVSLFSSTGIIFEPNYMLKTCLAARELAALGSLESDSTNVLVHTGGHFSLLDLPDPITPKSTLVRTQ